MKQRPTLLQWLLITAVVGALVGTKRNQRATVDIVLYETAANGELLSREYRIWGIFSQVAVAANAEGPVVQIHPMGLCTDGDFNDGFTDDQSNYGWVVVIKLEAPQLEPHPCMSIFYKAKRAIQRGATAVIFDITDNKESVELLRQSEASEPPLTRPLVLVDGQEAVRLMAIIGVQRSAHARIAPDSPNSGEAGTSTKEYFVMGIILVFFVIVCIICLIVVVKLKRRYTARQLSPTQLAKSALSKLQTRRFKGVTSKVTQRMVRSNSMHSDMFSCGSNGEVCAICLDQYEETQMRPCEIYLEEFKDCSSRRGKRHENFVYGEVQTERCKQWGDDYALCLKYRKTRQPEVAEELIKSERDRLNRRQAAARANNVWEYRTSPPKNWSDPVPTFEERHPDQATSS